MAQLNDWICIAENDLSASRCLLKEELLGPALYHTQQCAEKALKGYLYFKNQKIKKTHDLLMLITDCGNFDPKFETLTFHATELNPYVFVTRYPEDCLLIPDISTVVQSITLAEEILEFVKERI
jgi:HEPN domain-containing protein